jgi:integrase/recombinase XerC
MLDRTKYMSDTELSQLRTNARAQGTPIEWLLIDLATQTGLRVCEIARLFPKDFDFPRCFVGVKRAKKRSPKISPDVLALTPELSTHIQTYLRERPKGFYTETHLWLGQKGPLTIRGLQQMWHRCCKRAGLSPKISIHAARHTLAVRLLRSSHNLRMVQKQLGHSSPTTTANLYADVTFEDMQAALSSLFVGEG